MEDLPCLRHADRIGHGIANMLWSQSSLPGLKLGVENDADLVACQNI